MKHAGSLGEHERCVGVARGFDGNNRSTNTDANGVFLLDNCLVILYHVKKINQLNQSEINEWAIINN